MKIKILEKLLKIIKITKIVYKIQVVQYKNSIALI